MTIIAAAIVIIASWLLGGSVAWVPWMIGAVGWLSGIVHVMRSKDSDAARQSPMPKRLMIPWVLLFFLVLWSAMNAVDLGYEGHPRVGYYFDKPDVSVLIPLSADFENTVQKGFFLSGLMVLSAVTFASIKSRAQVRNFCAILFSNGFILCVVGVVFKLMKSDKALSLFEVDNHSFFGPFLYHNHYIGFLLLSLGLGVGLSVNAFQRMQRSLESSWKWKLYAVCTAFMAFSVPLAASRSGVLLVFLMLSIFFLLGVRANVFKFKDPETKKWNLGRLILLTVVLLCGAAGSAKLAGPQIKARLKSTQEQWSELKAGRIPDLRYCMARDTFKMSIDRPLFGWGAGAWHRTFPLFAGEEFYDDAFQMETKHFGKLIWWDNSHNDWLQYWATLGSVGFVLLLSVPLRLFLYLKKRDKKDALRSLSFVGVALVLVLSLWDSPLTNHAVLAYFMILLSVLFKSGLLVKRIKKGLAKNEVSV